MQKNVQEFGTKFENVCAILEKYKCNPHMLVPILQEIQSAYSYLPKDVMNYVATALGITPGAVFGVATFYSHFTLDTKGKYVIRVCNGTACHVRKAVDIIKTFQNELGLSDKKQTSDDNLFTLEEVACIGACGLAPVVTINDDVYGAMTKEKTIELIEKYRKEENSDA
ncbi:MAG: NAD(P)H-dependent oxidoreductase subunit E [Oscillospiraceae bacterium]|nr:NAD(P)H-dependent oxidoreductase subunit E [Oscillospiraceae bacterium]